MVGRQGKDPTTQENIFKPGSGRRNSGKRKARLGPRGKTQVTTVVARLKSQLRADDIACE